MRQWGALMAASTGPDVKAVSTSDVDLLLHPELLSTDFLQLILSEKKVNTRDCGGRDRLTELFMRHVVPLPQRALPNNRWGKRVEKARRKTAPTGHRSERDLYSSSHTGSLKVRKPDGSTVSAGNTDRLKPPPAANLSNPIRRLNTSSSSIQMSARSTDTTSLKREANSSGVLKSPEVKKKIQHVTWP